MKRRLLIAFYIISILLLIYSAFLIVDWYIENSQNKNIKDHILTVTKIKQNKDKYPYITTDLSSLIEENNDTVAWLQVPDTNINYPIVKTNDNDYYLNHNFNKNYNTAGWVFMDYRNTIDNLDSNTIIYGHNRLDSSMFGTLKNTLEDNWHKNNKYIYFNTIDKAMTFQVFSVYTVNINDFKNNVNFKSDSEFEDYLKLIKHKSIIDFNVDINYTDKILTLYTCSTKENERTILHAKLVQEKES